MIVQHAAPSVKVTPIAHASIGPVSLLAPERRRCAAGAPSGALWHPCRALHQLAELAEAASKQVPAAVIVLGDPHAHDNQLSHALSALKHAMLPETVLLIPSPTPVLVARLAAVRAGARAFAVALPV